MIVKLRRRNAHYPDLSTHQQYMVIGIEAEAFRLLNDEGRPYLSALVMPDLIRHPETGGREPGFRLSPE